MAMPYPPAKPLLNTVPDSAATTGAPSGAAKSRPECINQLPSKGWSRQPNPLLLKACPTTGNNKARLPFPCTGKGLGVTAKTDSKRKPPLPSASNADTGTRTG